MHTQLIYFSAVKECKIDLSVTLLVLCVFKFFAVTGNYIRLVIYMGSRSIHVVLISDIVRISANMRECPHSKYLLPLPQPTS